MEKYIFIFFLLGFTGWVLESTQETIVRKKFVNKGFFKGPFIPCQAAGGMAVYLVCAPLKPYPILVFLTGALLCTLVEYLSALFLEKCFNVKCWDYTTYPHTKWCHYKGKICLTISLFFGLAAILLVYVYWDFLSRAAGLLGDYIFAVDAVFCAVFLIDAFLTCSKVFKAKKAGVKLKGYAVFSE
jgi:uncharacterized membrane protein